jgi:hypothetical protein|tara:strand:- start:486 stop:797 length:312 start_codon:yes stop_codon:yes gene_type:complete
MAYQKVMNIKVFPNDKGAAKWGNSKFTPYKDGSPADIHLRSDVKYRVSVFEENDGSLGISITIPDEARGGTDRVADDVKQGGLKKLADSVSGRGMNLDDDIPF